jgi:hypothetical protein
MAENQALHARVAPVMLENNELKISYRTRARKSRELYGDH